MEHSHRKDENKQKSDRKDVEKSAHSENETAYYSADMQKVIMLPRLEIFNQAVFTNRLIVSNEYFVPIGKLNKKNTPFGMKQFQIGKKMLSAPTMLL